MNGVKIKTGQNQTACIVAKHLNIAKKMGKMEIRDFFVQMNAVEVPSIKKTD